MCLSILTRVSIQINGTLQAPIIDLVSIQLNKSSSQTHDAYVSLEKPMAIHLGQATKQRLQIGKLLSDNEKNSYCQG